MKIARIVRPKESLKVQDIKVPKPKGSQVLVKVLSAGVCHSDVHLWEGGYEGPERQFLKTTDRGIKYPLTPGHEIDRKSTRLNSSHANISYAVFCLKKKPT